MNFDIDKKNNFDFLRLSAAFGVLLSHQFALSGKPEPIFLYSSWGGLGVLVFFAISGYLVAGSWVHDPHLGRFAARRFLRVWPGLAVATCVTVFVLGPTVTSLNIDAYFSDKSTWTYFKLLGLWNFEMQLPGIFPNNPAKFSANGSLWTIPFEVKAYLILAIIGALGFFKRNGIVFLAAFIALAFWFFAVLEIGYENPRRMHYQIIIIFFFGASIWILRAHWLKYKIKFLFLSSLVVAALWFLGLNDMALTLGIPLATIIFGSFATPIVQGVGRFGDISYGLYIYAYPVQQTVVWATENSLSVFEGACIVIPVTIVIALLSWHFIEKPAIGMKKYLVRREIK